MAASPTFWKLSHGAQVFSYEEFMQTLIDKIAYVHRETKAKGTSQTTQADEFVAASIGDYFYLTWGNRGIYVLGQFTGPVNFFSKKANGWLDRPYRVISLAKKIDSYSGQGKWWSPNHNSTFVRVPDDEVAEFEKNILIPYFDIKLSDHQ